MGLCDGVVGVGSIGGSGVDDLRSGQGFLATGGYGIPSRWKNSPGIIPHSTRYRQSDFAHLEASASKYAFHRKLAVAVWGAGRRLAPR
jgi:hypothetical protein